ncbi:hypothetical protein RIF29_14858 [Crotalaria pallida]|uniref:Uncharacterized protein n=1 Tax=Crotalaria pallida TaxID=3830 RepID=A0AAN9FHX9_CROPI
MKVGRGSRRVTEAGGSHAAVGVGAADGGGNGGSRWRREEKREGVDEHDDVFDFQVGDDDVKEVDRFDAAGVVDESDGGKDRGRECMNGMVTPIAYRELLEAKMFEEEENERKWFGLPGEIIRIGKELLEAKIVEEIRADNKKPGEAKDMIDRKFQETTCILN